MENASKALIIAGAVLISIIIVSLGVYVFSNFSNSAKEMANMDEQEIASFNSKIKPYLGESISGSQVNALIQYVISTDISVAQSGETYKAITITFPGNSSGIKVNNSTVSYGTNTKRVETGSGKYYKVEGTYDSNGLITTINVTNKT